MENHIMEIEERLIEIEELQLNGQNSSELMKEEKRLRNDLVYFLDQEAERDRVEPHYPDAPEGSIWDY